MDSMGTLRISFSAPELYGRKFSHFFIKTSKISERLLALGFFDNIASYCYLLLCMSLTGRPKQLLHSTHADLNHSVSILVSSLERSHKYNAMPEIRTADHSRYHSCDKYEEFDS